MDKLCIFIRLLPSDALVTELKARGFDATADMIFDLLDQVSIQQKLAGMLVDGLASEIQKRD